MPRDPETPTSTLDDEVAEALTDQVRPVVELSYDVRRTLDDPEEGLVHDGVGRVTVYRVGGGHVVDDWGPVRESRWFAVASERLASLVREVASGDGWEVEACTLVPEPDWVQRYEPSE